MTADLTALTAEGATTTFSVPADTSLTVNEGVTLDLSAMQPENIEVVVHPQSVIHSAVEYEDGAVIAQLGTPDMRLPIQYALFYPDRRYLKGDRLDFYKLKQLTFEEPDMDTFEGLALALQAGKTGGSMPTVFNAANEKAVSMFLNREIRYLEITEIIRNCMEQHKTIQNPSVEEILQAEQETYEWINSNFSK